MNSIEAKIDALSKQIEEKRNKAVRMAKITAIVYAIIVIFVFGYTTFLMSWIQKATTVDNVSAYMQDTLRGMIPQFHQQILKYSKEQIPVLSDKIINLIHENIPAIEDMAKNAVSDSVGKLITEIKDQVFPQFIEVIRANSKEIGEYAEVLTDETATAELAKMIVSEMEKNIDYNIIKDEFYQQFNTLKKQLDELAEKPVSEMTKKELAERNALVNWMFMMKHGESFQSVLSILIRDFSYSLESFMDGSLFVEDPASVAKAEEEKNQ